MLILVYTLQLNNEERLLETVNTNILTCLVTCEFKNTHDCYSLGDKCIQLAVFLALQG